MAISEDENNPRTHENAPCPYCGRNMRVINRLKGYSMQSCNNHGVFSVDDETNDVWVLDGFQKDMTPIRRRWYLVENHVPLTVYKYREMLKLANYRRLEDSG